MINKATPSQNCIERHAAVPFGQDEAISFRAFSDRWGTVHYLCIQRGQDIHTRKRDTYVAGMFGHYDDFASQIVQQSIYGFISETSFHEYTLA